MREFLAIAKALSDEGRLRALMCLRRGPLCLCQLIEMLRLAPSTVSKHMAVLEQARLVDARKDGRWIYYSLAGRSAPAAVRAALKWATGALEGAEQVAADNKRLDVVLGMKVEQLCCHYKPAPKADMLTQTAHGATVNMLTQTARKHGTPGAGGRA